MEINPNPVNYNTKLNLNLEFSGTYEIEILNITGQVLKSFPINLDSHQQIIDLNLEAFSEGLFFIRLRQNGLILCSEKLLKI